MKGSQIGKELESSKYYFHCGTSRALERTYLRTQLPCEVFFEFQAPFILPFCTQLPIKPFCSTEFCAYLYIASYLQFYFLGVSLSKLLGKGNHPFCVLCSLSPPLHTFSHSTPVQFKHTADCQQERNEWLNDLMKEYVFPLALVCLALML